MANRGCGCSGFEPIIRYLPNGTTEVSTDNGVTWAANNNDPRFLPIPFLPRPEPPGEERRCNAAYSIKELLKQATDRIIADANAWASLEALLNAILAIIAAIFPGVGTIAAFIIAGVMTAMFFLGNALFNAAMTTQVYEEFQCLVYCHLDEEGKISTEGWIALKLDIYQEIAGIAGNWIWGWVSTLGPSGLNAATGMFTGVTADCEDCGCAPCEVSLGFVGTDFMPRPDIGEFWWSVNTVDSNPPFPSGNGDCYAEVLIPDCCLHSAYVLGEGITPAPPGNRAAWDCNDVVGFANWGLNGCQTKILWRTYEVGEVLFKIEACI